MDRMDNGGIEEYYDESITGEGGNVSRKAENLRPRRRKKHYLLRVAMVLLLGLFVYLVMTSRLFDIKTINVHKDGSHFTTADVIAMSGVKEGDNLFKIRTRKAEEAMLADPWVSKVQVKRALFDSLNITLIERKAAFNTLYNGKYILVGDSDQVLSVTDKAGPITLVEGLDIAEAFLDVKIKVNDKKALKDLQSLLKAMNDEGLSFSRIDISGVSPRIFVSERLVIDGKLKDLTKGMNSLKVVLGDLDSRKISEGVIKVSDNGTCTFNPVFTDPP